MSPELSSITFVKFIPDPEEGGFTAHIPNVPAYGEGDTKAEALSDLRVALRGYIDVFGEAEAVAQLRTANALDLRKLLDNESAAQ